MSQLWPLLFFAEPTANRRRQPQWVNVVQRPQMAVVRESFGDVERPLISRLQWVTKLPCLMLTGVACWLQSCRYTRRAVPLNKASFSSTEAPAARRLKVFHSTAQVIPIFSTGKLLSNIQRSGPNRSMQVSM